MGACDNAVPGSRLAALAEMLPQMATAEAKFTAAVPVLTRSAPRYAPGAQSKHPDGPPAYESRAFDHVGLELHAEQTHASLGCIPVLVWPSSILAFTSDRTSLFVVVENSRSLPAWPVPSPAVRHVQGRLAGITEAIQNHWSISYWICLSTVHPWPPAPHQVRLTPSPELSQLVNAVPACAAVEKAGVRAEETWPRHIETQIRPSAIAVSLEFYRNME